MSQATTAVLLFGGTASSYCIEWLCSTCVQLELQTRMLQYITTQGRKAVGEEKSVVCDVLQYSSLDQL